MGPEGLKGSMIIAYSMMRRAILLLGLALSLETNAVQAQPFWSRAAVLPEERFKNGPMVLQAFAPISESARSSIVKLVQDGKPLALGAIVDTNGFVITKSSEVKTDKVTCELADKKQVEATVMARSDEDDVALLRISAPGLKPIQWISGRAHLGEWAITQGIDIVPEAVGIVSTPIRKIPHKRAYIGVVLTNGPVARIVEVMPNLGAAKAGLKVGDIVIAVNNAPIKNRDGLFEALRQFRDGQTVKLKYQRNDQQFEAEVAMSARIAPSGRAGLSREERMNRMGGALSERAEDFELALQHDSLLLPWQCGGPLLNLSGQAMGLNIAHAGRTASYALPASLVRRLIDELKKEALTASARVKEPGT